MATDGMRQRMTALVREWERSGEPRRAFAKRHGLTVSQFDYWKRRARRDGRTTIGFAPVEVVGPSEAADRGAVEVVLAGGERVTVRAGASTELVRAVLMAVRASC
jgi:transposase-like protein